MTRLFEVRPDDGGLGQRDRFMAALCVVLVSAIVVTDIAMVNIALPTIARRLGASESATVWVANAYHLAGAMSILALASAGARLGLRRVFLGGLLVFTLACIGCAFARSLEMLVALRFLQGLGAAASVCVTPALYRQIFPLRLLGSALGFNAMWAAVMMAVGPVLGGLIVTHLDWPWIFALVVPAGLLALWLGLRALPRDGGSDGGGAFDVHGALLSAAAFGALVISVDRWSSASTHGQALVLLGLAALAAGLFLRRQRRAPAPLLPLDMFRQPRFAIASLTALHAFVGQGIAVVVLPFVFQGGLGYTPVESGLLFTAWPVAVVFAAPLAGRLVDRFGAAMLVTGGLVLLASGMAALALLGAQASVTAVDVLWRIFLCGLGLGLFQTPNNREFLSGIPDARLGNASGVLILSRQLGQSLGAALVAIALALRVSPEAILWLGAVAVCAAAGFSAARLRFART